MSDKQREYLEFIEELAESLYRKRYDSQSKDDWEKVKEEHSLTDAETDDAFEKLAALQKAIREEDFEPMAHSLYDGDWRSDDKDQLMKEYDLYEEDAEKLCERLAEIEASQARELYDVGWSSEEKDQLMRECLFSEENAQRMCERIAEIEASEKDKP